LIEFYNEDKFVTEEVLTVYWNDKEGAAKDYAKYNNIKYTSIKSHFIKKQPGDEI
jgi:hypothetical protein